ncbi:hypothetical protein ACFX2I_028078 [Malus domestica]
MASSSSSAAPSITNFLTIKLDRNNYPLWHAQFLPLLRSRNLLSYVTGETQCPSAFLLDDNGKFTDKVIPLYNEWIQTDQMILSWITSSLTPKKDDEMLPVESIIAPLETELKLTAGVTKLQDDIRTLDLQDVEGRQEKYFLTPYPEEHNDRPAFLQQGPKQVEVKA